MEAELATNTYPHDTRRTRSIFFWVRRTVSILLIALVTLCGAGALYQIVATARDRAAFPAPGQLVDVGGYKLHIHCVGDGSLTVILDHVGGGNSAQWGLVQPEIAKETRVCAYDRAGFGWSDPGPEPRDAQQSVNELHALLTNAHIPPPYVLVGHSFGGDVAQLYVAQHRDEIVGMVLVDSGKLLNTPGVSPEINAQWLAEDRFIQQAAPVLARLGVFRIMALVNGAPNHGDLPSEEGTAFDAMNLSTSFWDAVNAQYRAWPATSVEVLHADHHYGTLPLVVLSATEPADASRDVWTSLNTQLARASSNSIHRVVSESTHVGLVYTRAHAQVTSKAIHEVLESVRTRRPLAKENIR